MLIVERCSVAKLETCDNFQELLQEYGEEVSKQHLPPPHAKMELYRQFEKANALYLWAAFLNDSLIGFITVLAPILPHYGVLIASTESFFVGKEYRKTGAGLKLLKAAETFSKEIKSHGLFVSAPLGGDLAEVLPHVGYTETNRVFFRNLNNE